MAVVQGRIADQQAASAGAGERVKTSRRPLNWLGMAPAARGLPRLPLGIAIMALIGAGALWALIWHEGGMKNRAWLHSLAALGASLPAAGGRTIPLPSNMPVPPTTIGINLAAPDYWVQQRVFANLLMGSNWVTRIPGHGNLTSDEVDKDGNLLKLPGNQPVWRMLTLPGIDPNPVVIRCTYAGKGIIEPTMASAQDINLGKNMFTYRWRYSGPKASAVILKVSAIDPVDPIRNVDCREADLDPKARFAPDFLAFIRPFRILRFMDWERTNSNEELHWESRHTPASIDVRAGGGVSVEDMVAAAAETGADLWFNMPWNGDDNYIRNFARYVHDHVPRGRKVYVEAGNEVWNAAFPMSKQALQEGQSEKLDPNPEYARLYRYAERLAQVMDIWSKIFADRPADLVRVANCQNGPNRSDLVLGYKDTARHVDALATAPYFGYDFRHKPPATVDEAFARTDDAINRALGTALRAKAVAFKYHKRYIAYEAGQHIILKDVELAQKIQRDPRMYDAYKKYLDIWRSQIGDAIMMYESVQPMQRTGSWGLLEYLGQPLSEAPKMRAVRDALSGVKS